MNGIYSLLNEVETDINQYDRADLNDIEIQKLKKNMRGRAGNRHKSRIAASAACAAVAILLIGNTVFAEELQIAVKSIGWQIQNFLGTESNLQDYVTVLNTSRVDKGFTVTLNEVILDDKELIVSSTIKSEKPIGETGLMADVSVYVNGKSIMGSAAGGSRNLNSHTMEEVIGYDLEDIDTSKNLDFEIEYNRIRRNQTDVKGNWDFKFTADGKALASDTLHLPLNISYRLPNEAVIKLTEYTSNNLGEKIYFEISSDPKTKALQYDMELMGTDNLGNKIDFYMSSANGVEGTGCFKIDESVNKSATSLTLRPYAVKFPEKSGRLSNDFKPVGDEFTIDLTDRTE